jgi:tetratricopeptide (TPR) repeat protein
MATSPPTPQQIQGLIQLLNSGQLAQAEALAKKLIATNPNVFIVHHVLSLSLDGQQKYDEAVTSYQNALKLQSNNADLWFNCAIALTQLSKLDEAVSAYQKAIKIQPNFLRRMVI